MKSILVTGGAGYIGSHTCKALASAGYLPVAYDDLSRGHAWAVQWGPLERGNISDPDRLREVLRRYSPVAAIHFAGFGYVGESMQAPQLYYGNNVVNTAAMLEVFRATGLARLVFSSSCATYGGMHDGAIDETVEQRPLSPYGFSKLVIERMLTDYARAFGFRSIALRYFNAAGADPDGDIGESHDPEPHFIPVVLRVAAGLAPLVHLHGSDYPTPDGTCVRDYVHVSDLARGHVLALQALLEGGVSGAFNLGNGQGYSLNEIVDVARAVTGRTIATASGPRRPGDPAHAVADARLAATTLGWSPAYPRIADMVGHAWQWASREQARLGTNTVRRTGQPERSTGVGG